MRQQLRKMAIDFDWDREISTCDPAYYKWTQHLFLDLFNAGLVYKRLSTVNWDPVDQTVLANEQVDSQGRAERSGALVEKRQLEQWFVKITEYSESLHNDLEGLEHWPINVRQLQENWLGRSEGLQLDFKLRNYCNTDVIIAQTSSSIIDSLSVFTSRPESIYGVKFLAIATRHPLTQHLLETPSIINNNNKKNAPHHNSDSSSHESISAKVRQLERDSLISKQQPASSDGEYSVILEIQSL